MCILRVTSRQFSIEGISLLGITAQPTSFLKFKYLRRLRRNLFAYLRPTFQCHLQSLSRLKFHPRLSISANITDDALCCVGSNLAGRQRHLICAVQVKSAGILMSVLLSNAPFFRSTSLTVSFFLCRTAMRNLPLQISGFSTVLYGIAQPALSA